MKNSISVHRPACSSGFTLVELLVVIGIIAILAGVLLSAAGSALRAAQRTKTANLENQIQTAALAYYTEYSVYPVTSSATASQDFFMSDSDITDWKPFIESLCGNISPYSPGTTPTVTAPANAHAVAFLNLRATDVDSNDCPKNSISYDSVGHPYLNMAIDNDYDGIVGNSGTAMGKLLNFSTAVTGATPPALVNGTIGGAAIWANCNTTTTVTKWNPGFFVRTY